MAKAKTLALTCDRAKLAAAFQMAATVAPTRTPKPILQNVKLTADAGDCTLSATDQEIGICATVADAEVKTPGVALLPRDRFAKILRECRDDLLTISATDSGLIVKSARSEFKLPLESAAAFPDVKAELQAAYYTLAAQTLRQAISATVFATDENSARFAFGGVLFEVSGDQLTCVGCDGRRLAKYTTTIAATGDAKLDGAQTLISSKSLRMLLKLLGDEGDVDLCVVGNDAVFARPGLALASRLIEGKFPKWRKGIPTRTAARRFPILAEDLASAIRQAAIVKDEESKGIDFDLAPDALTISASTANLGETTIVTAVAYSGEAASVRLDNTFCLDWLRAIGGDSQVEVEIEGPDDGVLFECGGAACVVTPISKN
jgi:DNA polymerase-3 subunit beta